VENDVRKLRILLAEDNDGDVYLVRYSLRRASLDYELHVCTTGDEAVRHVESLSAPNALSPDILVLDLNLPGASGIEILRGFRKHCGGTPVLVFTSSEAPGDIDRALAAGANRYFQKPSQLRQFLQLGHIVRELVEGAHETARA
jgi:CheY-like chemotaxis protein